MYHLFFSVCLYLSSICCIGEEAEEKSGASSASFPAATPSPATTSSSLTTAASSLPAQEAPTTTTTTASLSSPSSPSSSTPYTTASSPPTAPALIPTSSSPAVTVHVTSSLSPHVLPELESTQPLTAPNHRSPSESLLHIGPDNDRVNTPSNAIRASARINPATGVRPDLLVSPDSMQPHPVPAGHTQAVATQHCTASLINKLHWAAHELETCQSVEYCVQLCQLITACGQALKALQESSPHQCSAEHVAETYPEE